MQKKLSTVVICQDEEKKITDCLESIKWTDEIVVVDAFSKDNTVNICKKYTDRVLQRQWTNYPDQLKFGVDKTKNDWVLFIDADERVSPELKDEILKTLSSDKLSDGYYIPRNTYYAGNLLRFWGKAYSLRLFNKSKAIIHSYKLTNEEIEIKGKISYLKRPMEHYTYDNLDYYFKRFNFYNSIIAKRLYESNPNISVLQLYIKMLIEPPIEFIRKFFFKLGFLGGIPVLIMSVMSALSKFVINVKYWEIKQNQKKQKQQK